MGIPHRMPKYSLQPRNMNMGISNEMLPAMHNPWFSHRMIEMLQEKCPHLVKLSWETKNVFCLFLLIQAKFMLKKLRVYGFGVSDVSGLEFLRS